MATLLVIAGLLPWTPLAFGTIAQNSDVAAMPADISDTPDDSIDADESTEKADPKTETKTESAAKADDAAEESAAADDEATVEEIAATSKARKPAAKTASVKQPQAADKAYVTLASGVLTFKFGDSSTEPAGITKYTNFNPSTSYTTNAPWYSRRTSITTAVIDPSFSSVNPTSTASWFRDCSNLTSVSGLENLNTSGTTNMSYMFNNCSKLASLDISAFDTSSATNMGKMFIGMSSLSSITFGSSFNFKGNNITTATNQAQLPTPTIGTKNWRKDGTDTTYTPANLKNVTGDALAGTWVWGTFAASYDANGGSGTIDKQYADASGNVTLSDGAGLANPAKHLIGWATSATGAKQFDPGAATTLTASKMFYAKWETNELSVDPVTGKHEYDGQEQKPALTVKGWDGSTLAEGIDYTVEWANNTLPGLATATVKGEGGYSQAAHKTVSFTITKRACDVIASDQSVLVGGTIDTSPNRASLSNAASGHRIDSVTLTSSDTSAPTTSGTITPSNATIVDAGGADVTAYYSLTYTDGVLSVKNGFDVNYDPNGGKGAISPQVTDNAGRITLNDGSDFSWSRHTLNGWNTAADGSGTAYETGGTVTLTDDVTLYAQWEKKPVEGDIKATVAKGSWGNARLIADSKELAEAIEFTDEEIARIEGGETAYVYVRAKDASSATSSALKKQLEAAANEGDSGYSLFACIDVTLYIRIGSDDPRQITETFKPLCILADLPAEMHVANRLFVVTREHEGGVSKINCLWNSENDIPDDIVFYSNLFSTFGMASKDSKGSMAGGTAATPNTGDVLGSDLMRGVYIGVVSIYDLLLIAYACHRMSRRQEALGRS